MAFKTKTNLITKFTMMWPLHTSSTCSLSHFIFSIPTTRQFFLLLKYPLCTYFLPCLGTWSSLYLEAILPPFLSNLQFLSNSPLKPQPNSALNKKPQPKKLPLLWSLNVCFAQKTVCAMRRSLSELFITISPCLMIISSGWSSKYWLNIWTY